jgi:hypothetical protein
LGLDSVDQLPSLGEFVPGPEVMDALEQGLTDRTRRPGGSGQPEESKEHDAPEEAAPEEAAPEEAGTTEAGSGDD